MLRRAREAHGLDLLTVHDRLARPITHLEALESGEVGDLPDQALALTTLRRYAAFLGLDGDALALQLMEAWSRVPTNGRRRAARYATSSPSDEGAPQPEHLRAFTQTSQVPSVAGQNHRNGPGTAVPVDSGQPTGILASVGADGSHISKKHLARARARARRRRRAPRSLRFATWLSVLAVLAAGAGLWATRYRPRLLANWHVLRVTLPNGAPLPTPKKPTPTPPATHPKEPVVTLSSTDNATTATYAVAAGHFTVAVATSAPCWIKVTTPASLAPVANTTLQAGQKKSFAASSALTVEVGASACTVGVLVGGKADLLVSPNHVPYFYTFHGMASGSATASSH